jgi:peptidoglycan/LPS O-acetylase OafA/YrhL
MTDPTYARGNAPDRPPTDEPGNPRAPVIWSGAVFQGVGIVLTLSGCAVWGVSGYFQQPADQPAASWLDFFQDRSGPALWTLGVLASFLHGLLMTAAGMGLQGERPRSGRLALGVCLLFAAVYLVLAVAIAVLSGRWLWPLVPLALTALTLSLLPLASRSASLLRQFPPPPDLNRATPEIMAEHRRKREERLRELD